MTASLTIAHSITDPRVLAGLASRLHADLQARLDAMTNPAVRAQRALAWWLRGVCVEALTGIAPARQRFATQAHGRPYLVQMPTVHISLTHTQGVAACLLSLKGCVGVDLESLARRANWARLERRIFTPEERLALSALPPECRAAECVRMWTLKEAWVKADGRGIGMGLGHIDCRRAGEAWVVRAVPGRTMARVGQRDIDGTWSLAWVASQDEELRLLCADPGSGALHALSDVAV